MISRDIKAALRKLLGNMVEQILIGGWVVNIYMANYDTCIYTLTDTSFCNGIHEILQPVNTYYS